MAILPVIFAALIASAHCMPLSGGPLSLDATTVSKRPTAWSIMVANSSLSIAPPQPLLMPDDRFKWPLHVKLFKNLLKNLAEAPIPLVEAGKRVCKLPPHAYSAANSSVSKWQGMLNDFTLSKGKTLVQSQYLDAVVSLRPIARTIKTACEFREWDSPPVQERIFEILMDTILVVGCLSDTSGYDRIPAYLQDAPWETFNDFFEILTFEFKDAPIIRWQDEDI